MPHIGDSGMVGRPDVISPLLSLVPEDTKVLALNSPGSYMGAGSNPGGPASDPAPCLWPGKAVKDSPKL